MRDAKGCARWTQEIADCRQAVGRAKRNHLKRSGVVREARRALRRAIRRAKRQHWNDFVSGATGQDVWIAARYTKPTVGASVRPLVDEHGSIATSREEKERMIIQTAIPPTPSTVPFDL